MKRLLSILGSDSIIISSNFDNTIFSKEFGINTIYFDDFLSKEDYEYMNNYAYNLAESWYLKLPEKEAVTSYNKTPLGRLSELEAQKLFSTSIKSLELVLKAINKFDPGKIVFIEENGSSSFLSVSDFIKNSIAIPILYINLKDMSLSKYARSLYRNIIDIFCDALDEVVSILLSFKKINDRLILMDHRLIPIINGIDEEFRIFPYIMETGFRIRHGLLFKKKSFYIPLSHFNYNIFSLNFLFKRRGIKICKEFFKSKAVFKYRDLVIDNVLYKDIQSLLVNTFPRIYGNSIFLNKALKKIQPGLVILREAVRELEKTLNFVAKEQKISTLVIQHGANNESNVYSKYNSDYIALWGQKDKEWYESNGNDVSRALVTGNPLYDKVYSFLNNGHRKNRDVLSEIGLDINKKTVVYLATFIKDFKPLSVYYNNDYCYFCLATFLNTIKDHENKQFVIKLHPFYDRSYKHLIKDRTKPYSNITVIEDIDLFELFYVADLVISDMFSTALLSAVILDKPVISLNFFKREEPLPLARRGVALEANRPELLSKEIDNIFKNIEINNLFKDNRKSFIYDYAYDIDGMATNRIKEFVKKIYSANSPYRIENG